MRAIHFRAARLLVIVVTVPLVLILTRCSSSSEEAALRAKKWCEGTMAIFESDRDAFFTRHARRMHHGLLVVRPDEGLGPSTADFAVKQSGEYACRYWRGSVFFAEGYRYTSERPRWLPIE